MSELRPGNTTTEWKAWVTAICGSLAVGLASVLATGLIPDVDGFGAYKALAMVASVLAAIGGITLGTNKYIDSRTKVKVADAVGPTRGGPVPPAPPPST
jgi:hypothetical protein